jgi:PAS domain S-box-containing protein
MDKYPLWVQMRCHRSVIYWTVRMLDFIKSNADYLTLIAASFVVAWLVQRWLAKRGVFYAPTPIWVTLGAVLACGWFATQAAGNRERSRIKELMEGFPPTYAVELERLGHSSITPQTAANDPVYLELIAAENRWIQVNPYINDIYTIGKTPEGKLMILVDSETDYDRNGKIEGELEARTPIGEPYFSPDPSLQAALNGAPGFSAQPYSDRWGQWVSAYYPLRDAQGTVSSIVGVDFIASDYLAAISRARLGAIAMVVVATLLCLGLVAVSAISRLQRDNAEQRKLTAIQKTGRERFENLVNSIDGIVYEFNLQSGQFDYVSNQAEAILGFPASTWLNKPHFWESRLFPDEKDKVIAARNRFLNTRASFEVEYRLVHSSGHEVWVRERSQAPSSTEAPTLVRGVLFDVSQEKKTS